MVLHEGVAALQVLPWHLPSSPSQAEPVQLTNLPETKENLCLKRDRHEAQRLVEHLNTLDSNI